MFLAEARKIFEKPETRKVVEEDGVLTGFLYFEPRGSDLVFIPKAGYELIRVDGSEFERALRAVCDGFE